MTLFRRVSIGVVILAGISGFLANSAALASRTTRTVEESIVTPALPEEAIRAFLDAESLSGWWHVTRSLVIEEANGVWAIAWDDYDGEGGDYAWSGVISRIEPTHIVIENLVMFEAGSPILFGPMRLELVAEPADAGSLLTIRHSGYQYGEHWDGQFEVVVLGWRHVLGNLKLWFEGGKAPLGQNTRHVE